MKSVTLNNGVEMPMLGFGVYQITDPDECERCILEAIDVGYRLFDTAQGYGNETSVGNAIQKTKVKRSELFITTKVWISNAGYEKAKASILKSLVNLQTEYIDLVLIHQPFGDYYGTYRAMTELYKQGKIRAIGVSNFYPDRLIDFIQHNEILPAVNQVEVHPYHQQIEAHNIMKKYNVQIQAWAPFAEGKNNLFEDEILNKIGAQYGKSNAQVALHYLIQRGISVLPKTVHKERMLQNFQVLDFELSDTDLSDIAQLDTKESQFFDHRNPEIVEYLTTLKR